MMRIKTSELTGDALDWVVTKIEAERKLFTIYPQYITPYSTDWAQGGPIIQREELSSLKCYSTNEWGCLNGEIFCEGPTPLIAAMRCYVASKLGDDIDIPEELTP
jgi:hypothetical protein